VCHSLELNTTTQHGCVRCAGTGMPAHANRMGARVEAANAPVQSHT